MKNKVSTAKEAVSVIHDGAVIMVGGSMTLGTPENLIDALVAQNTKNLTIICNDGGLPGRGVAKLIANGQVKHLITTHVGLNPEVTRRVNSDNPLEKMTCELVPQGTFAERLRSGGAGIGGILTRTGVGTLVADGKDIINVDGVEYLLELPLHADFALVRGARSDTFGNTVYLGTAQNFNPLMASAADHVIMGTSEIVSVGNIDPNHVITPGIFVDAVVGGEHDWKIEN